MQVKILARNPTDQFGFNFFQYCVNAMPENSAAYYIWAEPLENIESMITGLDYNYKNVLLCISDNLSLHDYNPKEQTYTYATKFIAKILEQNPATNFILVTDITHLDKELGHFKNAKLVSLTYLVEEAQHWPLVPAVTDKNFNSTTPFISLSHRPAAHRVALVSYLLSQGLDKHGVINISTMFQNHIKNFDSLLDIVSWDFIDEAECNFKPKLLSGFELAKCYNSINNDYKLHWSHFANNYTHNLIDLYKNSFVELIAETYYAEPSFMLTEKTLNSVYGCNFPIFVGPVGAVEYLESIGFDMFRDIVNQDYDSITDPFMRLQTAVDSNVSLLRGTDIKRLWETALPRFENNIRFARSTMYDVVRKNAEQQFKLALASTDFS